MDPIQYSGPTTTANSQAEGRMKVDVSGQKRKILKKKISSKIKKNDTIN